MELSGGFVDSQLWSTINLYRISAVSEFGLSRVKSTSCPHKGGLDVDLTKLW